MIARPSVAMASLLAVVSAGGLSAQAPAGLCGGEELDGARLARRLEPLGETGRTALVGLVGSRDRGELLCGIAGLSALRDRRAIPFLVAALRNPGLRDDTYKLARWGAYLAGAPDPGVGPAMREVIDAFGDPAIWDAAGVDAIWLMGEIDQPAARERLLRLLEQPAEEASVDAVVYALARQGEPRARESIAALGTAAIRARSGNATPEQARRIGAVAFYQLALGPESLAEGLATLAAIATRDQAAAATWAVHTLCARARRRPDEAAAIDQHRAALTAALDQRGVSPVDCPAEP